jgi:hypothetical protein
MTSRLDGPRRCSFLSGWGSRLAHAGKIVLVARQEASPRR